MIAPRRVLAGLGLSLLLCGAAAGETANWQQRLQAHPGLLGDELRRFFEDEPEVLGRALAAVGDGAHGLADRMTTGALRDEISGDRQSIRDNRDALFAPGPSGFGSEGYATITLFTVAGCGACLASELELKSLARRHPALRVELRSMTDGLADRIAWVIARQAGHDRALSFREALGEHMENDSEALGQILSGLGFEAEPLLAAADAEPVREAVAAEAALSAKLGLDMAPSYVFPDKLVRGAMPVMVLEGYLTE